MKIKELEIWLSLLIAPIILLRFLGVVFLWISCKANAIVDNIRLDDK